jgi:hypothetical protein
VVLRLVLAFATLGALPVTCAGSGTAPGEVNYRAPLTVLNRTTAEVIVYSQAVTINVPACQEIDVPNFLINSWQVTSPGRDMIRSAGGHSEEHSYLIVTGVVRQVAARPDPLPDCNGLLQPR